MKTIIHKCFKYSENEKKVIRHIIDDLEIPDESDEE